MSSNWITDRRRLVLHRTVKSFLYAMAVVIILVILWIVYTPRVIVIDGCEYIETVSGYSRTLVHKANCSNHKVMP